MKEYWELYITQGENRIWLKTYNNEEDCVNDMLNIAKIIRNEIYYIRSTKLDDGKTIWYDFGSHTTFFETKKVVK